MDWLLLSLDDLAIKNGITWLNDWMPLSVLALMTVFVIYIVILMFAKSFSVKELERWVYSEMAQAAATAVMVGSLILLVNGAMDLGHSYISGDLTCGSKSLHIGTTSGSTMAEAFDAIKCRLTEKASAVASIQGNLAADWQTVFDFNLLNSQISVLGITVFKGDWVSSVYQETERKRITNNIATTLLIGLNAQASIVDYIKANALSMFIPLGVLLRSFQFTRTLGALFLAFGVGMYFIFPVFFVLLDPGFTPAPPPPTIPPPSSLSPYCYSTMSSTVTVLKTLQAGGLGTTNSLASANVASDLSKAYIQLMLHPMVAFFLTMVFVRYMMTILGADTYEVMRMVTKVV